MANKILKCPHCKKTYQAGKDVRFCEDDGTPLVEEGASSAVADSEASRSSAIPREKSRNSSQASSSTLIALGLIIFAIGLVLPPFDFSLPQKPPSRHSAKRFKSVNATLEACFGADIPPIPKPTDTKSEAAFQQLKAVTKSVSAAATSDVKISAKEESKIGDAVLEAIIGQETISDNVRQARRVPYFIHRLSEFAPRGEELDYQGTVLAGDKVNAAMLPGGRLLVWEGLLTKLPRDDELAAVIGHEIAHAELRHHDNVLRFSKAGGQLSASILGGLGADIGAKLGVMGGNILASVYDQDQEFEADRLGICLAHLADFNQQNGSAARALAAVEAASASQAPDSQVQKTPQGGAFRVLYDIVNTHPNMTIRQKYAQDLSNKLRKN